MNTSNIYINSKCFSPRSIIWNHYLQTHHRLAEITFQSLDCTKNEEIFRQLSMINLSMVGNLRLRVVNFRWNHSDPTVGSPEISPRSSSCRWTLPLHHRPLLLVLPHSCRSPLDGVPWSCWAGTCLSWRSRSPSTSYGSGYCRKKTQENKEEEEKNDKTI